MEIGVRRFDPHFIYLAIMVFLGLFIYNVATFRSANLMEVWSLKRISDPRLLEMAADNPETYIRTSGQVFLFLEKQLAGKKLILPPDSPLKAELLERRSRLGKVIESTESFTISEGELRHLLSLRKTKELGTEQKVKLLFVYPADDSPSEKDVYIMARHEDKFVFLPIGLFLQARRYS